MPLMAEDASRWTGLERRLHHLLAQVRFGEVNILQGRLFLFVPHQLLKSRQAHVLIRFVCAEGVPERLDIMLHLIDTH